MQNLAKNLSVIYSVQQNLIHLHLSTHTSKATLV